MADQKEAEKIRVSIPEFCRIREISKTDFAYMMGFTKQKLDYLINHKVGNMVEYSEDSLQVRVVRIEEIIGECQL